MKLSALSQVSALERQRAVLVDQRDNGSIAVQLVGSMRMGGLRTVLSADDVEQLRPAIVARLDELIERVDQELRSYGVQVDL